MDIDIIMYAVVAVVLLARLWSVLGRRQDDERQRPNPFVVPAPGQKEENKAALPASAPRAVEPLAPPRPLGAAPASLAGGLEQIKALDPSFDEKTFLQGARTAFGMIVGDFAKGDTERLGRLVGPAVLSRFQKAIEARRQAGETMENRVGKIREAETAVARVEESRALITVRFVSEQQNILRNARGEVIGGHPGTDEEIIDLWTFARDTKSGDPNWILIETRS
ncbi:MAG: Tim44/TimA family putative adaptor protein [Pseudomonadota bacterium]|nr:Tim44/TimA family putative adaptor protein [Pseudomonadota bacterium]